MRVPTMQGVVERRLLINYRVDRNVVATMIPAPFEPQLVNGWAVAGICLIRLGHMRPHGLPARLGLGSENAAHRFAVQWHDETGLRTGVYIPTRHSASSVNVALGDRFFPGFHERADSTNAWQIEAAQIRHVHSSFFDDRQTFAAGTIHLDSALIMRNVAAEWYGMGSLTTGRSIVTAAESDVVHV